MIYTDKPIPDRRPNDSYWTPEWAVEMCLDLVQGKPRSMLDPAAGGGVWGKVARERWPDALIIGNEIDRDLPKHPAYSQWVRSDFLGTNYRERFDLIVGNVPYSEGAAERFVRRSLPLLSFGGRLIFLLRLTFLEGKARATGLFQEYPLQRVHVLGRVNFLNCGSSSPYAQAAFCWQQGWDGLTTITWPDWKKHHNGTTHEVPS